MLTIKKYFSLFIMAGLAFTACQDHSTSKESLNDSLENKKQQQYKDMVERLFGL